MAGTQPTAASASEVTTLWRFTNMLIIIIIIVSEGQVIQWNVIKNKCHIQLTTRW